MLPFVFNKESEREPDEFSGKNGQFNKWDKVTV